MKEKGILLFLKYLHLIINKIFLNVSVHVPTEGSPLLLHGGVTPSGRTHQPLLLRAGEVSDEPVHLQHPLPGKHAAHSVISHEGSRCLGRLKEFPTVYKESETSENSLHQRKGLEEFGFNIS